MCIVIRMVMLQTVHCTLIINRYKKALQFHAGLFYFTI